MWVSSSAPDPATQPLAENLSFETARGIKCGYLTVRSCHDTEFFWQIVFLRRFAAGVTLVEWVLNGAFCD